MPGIAGGLTEDLCGGAGDGLRHAAAVVEETGEGVVQPMPLGGQRLGRLRCRRGEKSGGMVVCRVRSRRALGT